MQQTGLDVHKNASRQFWSKHTVLCVVLHERQVLS